MPKQLAPVITFIRQDDALVNIDFTALTEAIDSADKEAFIEPYREIRACLSGLQGSIPWHRIESALIPKELHDSHACAQLRTSFVELLKNSLDAAIAQRVANNRASTMVSVQVSVDLTIPHQLSIVVTDDAGGMSSEALEKVVNYCQSIKNFEQDIDSESKKTEPYYFGGACLGLKMLIASIEHLSTIEHHRVERLYMRPKQGNCHVRFTNVAASDSRRGGLQVVITTPREPLKELGTSFDERAKTVDAQDDRDITLKNISASASSAALSEHGLFKLSKLSTGRLAPVNGSPLAMRRKINLERKKASSQPTTITL